MPAFRPTPRMHLFRSAARYLTEPHPFARNPVASTPHAVDWGVYVKRLGRTSGAYFPFYLTILGWPLGAKFICDKIGM